ncbi:MAG: replication-relaxation family protein [Sedimentibacter sp.]
MNTKSGRRFKRPDIKNLKSKLHAIGLDIEYVTCKEEIIIYLIYYLGVVTIEQLCVLFGVLETSIKTSIARIQKNGDVIEIKKDDLNNIYYLPTRKTLTVLKEYCEVNKNRNYKNMKHLSKVNDFFLTLFKSDCDEISIEYEKNIKNQEFIVRADAVIDVKKDGQVYEFILEQDNKTEKITKFIEKIENYYNVIIHNQLYSEKIIYYFFKFDVFLNKNHISKCEKVLNNSNDIRRLMNEIKEIQSFYYNVKNCIETEEYYEERADELDIEYSENRNTLLNNISIEKSKLLKKLDIYKRSIRLEISTRFLKDRINKVKAAMLEDFTIKVFDDDSIDTIYSDITGRSTFASIYSKLESKDILLRTNILIGDRRTEYLLKFTIINLAKVFKSFIKGAMINHNDINLHDIKLMQAFKTIGYQTLCFSNYCTLRLKNANFDVDFVLFMPTISLSDYCRIEYLLNLDLNQINDSSVNFTSFIILAPDKKTEEYYKEKIKNFKSNIYRFNICLVNITEFDDELTEVDV